MHTPSSFEWPGFKAAARDLARNRIGLAATAVMLAATVMIAVVAPI